MVHPPPPIASCGFWRPCGGRGGSWMAKSFTPMILPLDNCGFLAGKQIGGWLVAATHTSSVPVSLGTRGCQALRMARQLLPQGIGGVHHHAGGVGHWAVVGHTFQPDGGGRINGRPLQDKQVLEYKQEGQGAERLPYSFGAQFVIFFALKTRLFRRPGSAPHQLRDSLLHGAFGM